MASMSVWAKASLIIREVETAIMTATLNNAFDPIFMDNLTIYFNYLL
jgi:hypothetical protein